MDKRYWTEKEVDGLLLRLLQNASYRRDNGTVRFLIEHLRKALIKELT
jgi:hypothetical protein